MSVLSDSDIAHAVHYGDLDIEPYDEANLQPASYDVRLGSKLYHVESDTMTQSESHTIEPFERYLGHTEENILIPDNIAGQLAGRSTIGRRGVIVHKTAGFLDPSFSGDITLEIMNLGSDPVILESGKRVAQIVFFELTSKSSGYNGKYQNQSGPTKSR
jgi:dCTP deaminase